MSITEAFEGVPRARQVPTVPAGRQARTVQAKKATRDGAPAHVGSARRTKRVAASVRRTAAVVYSDTADSWLLNGTSPSAKTLWNTDYAAHVPQQYDPFVVWCRCYRIPAVAVAWVLDALKWLLVHPVRGLLTVATCTILTASVALTTNH